MSEELDILRQTIEAGDYTQALALVDEMDEMSRDDKINKIMSYMSVLLLHMIKQAAEQRSIRSWGYAMEEALDRIAHTNQRRRAGGYYLDDDALELALTEAWPSALRRAAQEAFGGVYGVEDLATRVDRAALLAVAIQRIKARR